IPRPCGGPLAVRGRDQPGHAHRALHGVQPDRAHHHDRCSCVVPADLGQEIRATSDLVTPETPEAAELQPEDSHATFVRNTAVMSVGTALSRLTGFLRLAAMAYALGIAETRLADAYNIANITPNIIYELALGGILSSVFVPVFVEWLQTRGREEAWHTARAVMTFAAAFLGVVMVLGIVGSGLIIRAYTFNVHGAEG